MPSAPAHPEVMSPSAVGDGISPESCLVGLTLEMSLDDENGAACHEPSQSWLFVGLCEDEGPGRFARRRSQGLSASICTRSAGLLMPGAVAEPR